MGKLIPARTEGELMALKFAVREIAKQVEKLSDGEPFLATALGRTIASLDSLASAVGMVDELPQEQRAYVETLLNAAKSDAERIFAASDDTTGFAMRH